MLSMTDNSETELSNSFTGGEVNKCFLYLHIFFLSQSLSLNDTVSYQLVLLSLY